MFPGLQVIQRVIAMMPPGSIESTTLGSLQAAGTYTNVTFANTRRLPATLDQMMLAGAQAGDSCEVFELYKTTESTEPKVLDRITDASSVVWQIKHIQVKMQRCNFVCTCLQNK